MLLENKRRNATDGERLFKVSPDRPMALLQRCPAYAATPMSDQPHLARELGLASLTVKDESQRMGLGSFKALGGAFAVAQMIVDRSGDSDPMSDRARNAANDMTFITASAGNHGMSVAAGARVFGAQAIIALSRASVPASFAERIEGLGASVLWVDGSYEDSVAMAAKTADKNGYLHLADGSWPGYVDRPALVMEGYTVIPKECQRVFSDAGTWPSHVYLQAGVGGLAAAFAAHIRCFWPVQPLVTIVEPAAAPCLLRSVEAGAMTHAAGPQSNMGRLDCKDASLIAFEALRNDADRFMTISDQEALDAADRLARNGVGTTPSGAAGFAGVTKDALGPDARCLVIVSEGPA